MRRIGFIGRLGAAARRNVSKAPGDLVEVESGGRIPNVIGSFPYNKKAVTGTGSEAATDRGYIIICDTSGGAITRTLPLLSTVSDGTVLSYVCDGANALTIIRHATDGGETVLVLEDGASVTLCVNSSAPNGWVILAGEGYGRRGHIDGLTLSNNGTDSAHDIDIAAGEATAKGGGVLLQLTASITKQIDASWAVGTNQGGLDGTETVAGTPDANTWYHMWLIRRSDTGVVDALFSESGTSPAMPTNYDQKRRIGAVLTDGSSNIIAFHQIEDRFSWKTRIDDVSDTTPGTAANLAVMTVPTGVNVLAIVNVWMQATSAGYVIVTSPDETDVAAGATNADAGGGSAFPGSFNEVTRKTNTSAQLRYRSSVGTVTALHINTRGWIDPRGKND